MNDIFRSKNIPKPIYSSLDSSKSLEKISRSSVICLVVFFLFQRSYILLKTLADKILIPF